MLWILFPFLFQSLSLTSALQYPSSGFLHGKIHQEDTTRSKITLKIKSYTNEPIYAQTLQFNYFPSNLRLNTNIFQILPEKFSYNRPVWTNGREYLYFIINPNDSNAPEGTWLIGREIGVDSGLAFLKPKSKSFIPLGKDLDGESDWHILSGKSWNSINNMTISTSSPLLRLVYYEVEYLAEISLQNSILLLSSAPSDSGKFEIYTNALQAILSVNKKLSVPSSSSSNPLFWSLSSESWASFSLEYTIPLGSPVILATGASVIRNRHQFKTNLISKQETIGHLINDEYLETGWRLSFRLTDAGNELELMIGIDNNGLQDGYYVSSNTLPSSYYNALEDKIEKILPGEYSWIWFDILSPDPASDLPLRQQPTNMILKCISRGKDIIAFEYFHSDRRDAMSRSVLSHSLNYMYAKQVSSTTSSSSFKYQFYLDDRKVDFKTLFTTGSNPIRWLSDYLVIHENALAPNLSSCFMYHAGTTIPQQFIYAAEILCFLLGAKPITMIQYSSPSDHQWKFPLVTQLSKAIILGKTLYPTHFDTVQYQINTYGSDQTLIFYRNSTKSLLELLAPPKTAQALHIVPYPSESDGTAESMSRILKEQIFNSWWNGYLLGYPDFMIDSYCYNFHSDLSYEEKIYETQRAKAYTLQYFQQHHSTISRKSIQIGNEINLLTPEIIKYLSDWHMEEVTGF